MNPLLRLKKMNKIEKASFYCDDIISKTLKENYTYKLTKEKINKLEKIKRLERNKIKMAYSKTFAVISKIIYSFDKINEIDPIYIKLLDCDNVDVIEINRRLILLKKISSSINKNLDVFLDKLKIIEDIKEIHALKKASFGYLLSRIKRLDPTFEYFDYARKKFKDMPDFKENYKTIAIAGFPNVGKSTLLKKLTSANPEIKPYNFTTKKLNLGYYNNYQFIDTPGTLNRDEMNDIEKKADIVMTDIADKIIFVIDATLGHPLSDQIELLKHILKLKKEVIGYISMTDVLSEDVPLIEKEFLKHKVKMFTSADDLKEFL